jgi:hypothetical protein
MVRGVVWLQWMCVCVYSDEVHGQTPPLARGARDLFVLEFLWVAVCRVVDM